MLDNLYDPGPVLGSQSQEVLAVPTLHDLSFVQPTDQNNPATPFIVDPQRAKDLSHRTDERRPRSLVTNITCDAVSKIEDVFEAITESLLNDDKSISIRLKKRQSTLRSTQLNSDGLGSREICFPGSTPQEAWRFSQALHIA